METCMSKAKQNNFLTNSSTFSESHFLKSKLLKPILESYNKLIAIYKSTFVDQMNFVRFIPNNGNKYYLFITDKSNVTNDRSNYKIMYFFPENCETQNDFFIETELNHFEKGSFLLEGYIYNQTTDEPTFLVTDLLYYKSQILDCDYTLRLKMCFDLIRTGIYHINCFLNINIHPTFKCHLNLDPHSPLLSVFKNNFLFAKEINSIEYVQERCITTKTRKSEIKEFQNNISKKRVEKTKYSDTYKVFNIETGDAEGILYIKTLDDSKSMRELTRNHDSIIIECRFNKQFSKWSGVVSGLTGL